MVPHSPGRVRHLLELSVVRRMPRSLSRAAPAPLAIKPLAGILVGLFALLMVTANGYGFHRDELYFMEAGHHPAWGYDDQPPLTPLIARGATAVFGSTPA